MGRLARSEPGAVKRKIELMVSSRVPVGEQKVRLSGVCAKAGF